MSRWLDHITRALNNQDMILLYPEFFTVHTIESFTLEDEKHNILKNIHYGNKSGRQEETEAKIAREFQHSSVKSLHSSEVRYIFHRFPTLSVVLSLYTITPKWQNMLDDRIYWSLFHRIIGSLKCHDILASILALAIFVFRLSLCNIS